MLADMVTPGNRLVDVGCDHGYLSIYLVREGVCPEALAMDIRKGPLACAEEHIRESGLGDYIKVRLSDGLEAYAAGEAETMVCAGMGGRLMEKILTDSMEKVRQLKELILQPQSELQEFRIFLRKSGFAVTKESAVCEEGKYYFAMKAVPWFAGNEEAVSGSEEVIQGNKETVPGSEEVNPGNEEAIEERRTTFGSMADRARNGTRTRAMRQLYDMFGELLLKERHPILLEFLLQRQNHLNQLRENLTMQHSVKAAGRCVELEEEIAVIRDAISFYDSGH